MSTESPTNRADVSGDVSSAGQGGPSTGNSPGRAGADPAGKSVGNPAAGSAGKPGPSRRSRRGRRRRRAQDNRRTENSGTDHRAGIEPAHSAKNPNPKNPNGKNPNGKNPDTQRDRQRKRAPSPADVARATSRSHRVEAGLADAEPADCDAETSIEGAHAKVTPPKPSDIAVVSAQITKTGLAHASNGPKPGQNRNRRRTARTGERGGSPDRLQTVRETSAGGLVISDLELPVDELSAALIGRVDRRGRLMWSLPKGHIETGETAEQTAIREVAEETGIQGTVVAPLGKIDYWFVSEGKRIHKTVHHYLLRSVGGELSDADYEVSEVAWVPLHELPRKLTYSDERRLARMARGVIADLAADPARLAQSEAESSRTEPNAYERAAAARNQRRNDVGHRSEVKRRTDSQPQARPRRRRRRPRRPASGDA